MTDQTESIRRQQQAALNAEAAATVDPRAELSAKYGEVWDTSEMSALYTVEGFMAPYVVVVRKADRMRGTLAFSHRPRFYHSFSPE